VHERPEHSIRLRPYEVFDIDVLTAHKTPIVEYSLVTHNARSGVITRDHLSVLAWVYGPAQADRHTGALVGFPPSPASATRRALDPS
jgi:hypothetical protein